MQHLIFFGLPGAGKTYAGQYIASTFGYTFFDGDQELPPDMIRALNENQIITDDMRNRFMIRLQEKFSTLITQHNKVILSQTFLQDHHRQEFAQAFPEAVFILVHAPDALREKRYTNRKEFSFRVEYLRQMAQRFEPIHVPYLTLVNSSQGTQDLHSQFMKFLEHTKKK